MVDRGIAGIILAGGLARRMGGGDKPLLALGNGRLVDHVVERLSPQVGALAINVNGEPGRFANLGLQVVPDDVRGHQGPLAGILAGMEWARNAGCHSMISAAGDTPFLPLDLVERLAAAAQRNPDRVAVASSGGRHHPTFALWPLGLREALRHFLVEEQNRRVWAFVERHGHIDVEFAAVETGGERIDPFFNINTPDDLAVAERLLQRLQP